MSALFDTGIQTSITRAMEAWRRAVGSERVITDTARYALDTSSFTARIPVALRPETCAQVQEVVKIAQRFSVSLYPISTGHNWGYGTAVPVQSPSAIVDLSGMNRIIEFDEELGVVTLEPGVTQGQLSEYLRSRNLPFLVPVTGAGPSCSILANALERGFGVTPVTDHCGAIMSLKAVLPSGEIYESYSRAFNERGVARAFRWGTGPYLDGLFSQSNLGIVVDASVALQRKTECSGALLFAFDSDEQLEGVVAQIKALLSETGQNIGAVNVMNRSRVESMLGGNRRLLAEAGLTTDQSTPPGAWFGFGSVYGSRECFPAACRLIQRRLKGCARRIRVYTSHDVKRLRLLSKLAAAVDWRQLTGMVERLEAVVKIVDGVPSTFALPLAYANSGRAKDKQALNPAQDGCGLFWYAPIVPLRSGAVDQFVQFARRICEEHGLIAAITLTALSPRACVATIPLSFDRNDPRAERQAIQCFEHLYDEGLSLGFMPYRMGAQFMPFMARNEHAGNLANAIKGALDPNQIMAPGRYPLG